MHRFGKIMAGFLSLCLVFHLGAAESIAAGREPYTYTVTFHAGNNGSFPQSHFEDFLTVDGSASSYRAFCSADGRSVTVSGISANARISYDAAAEGAVELPQNGRYYVKGIRESGHDNAEAGNRADMVSVHVTKDLDYVVAYGIRGDMTTYTVLYQDVSGNTLAPDRTYSGNVGDRPVAGYRYMEGYQPQAYNLTRTLVKNAAENIFTFVYSPIPSSSGGSGSGSSGGSSENEGGAGAAAGTEAASAGGAAGTVGSAPGGAAGAIGTAAGTAAAGIGNGAESETGGAAGTETAPDEEVLQDESPQELMELDDEEIPLAAGEDSAESFTGNMLRSVAIGAIAAAALLVLFVLWMKNYRKKDKEEA